MIVKMILPETGSARTHLQWRVALLANMRSVSVRSSTARTIRMTNRSGIIQFTFTA